MKIQARQYVGAWLVCVLVFSLVYYGLWYTDQAEHREKLAEAESRCNKIFQEASRSFNQEFQARAIFSEIHEALIPLFAPDGTASSPAVPFPVDDDVVQTVDQACGKTGFKPIVIYGTTGSEPRLIGHDLSQQRPVSPIAIKAAQTLATMFDALEKRRFDTQAFNQYVRTFETEMEAGQHPEEYRRLRTVFGPGFHLITHKAFGSQRGIRSIPYFGRNAFFYWGWLGQPDCGRIVFLIYQTDLFNESISAGLGRKFLQPSLPPEYRFRFLAQSKNPSTIAHTLLQRHIDGLIPSRLVQHGSSWWYFKRLDFFQNPTRYLLVHVPDASLRGSFAPLFTRRGITGSALLLLGILFFIALARNHYETHFVSLRIQMALVFISATLLPIATLVFIGFEYLRDRSRLLIQSEYENLANEGLKLDGEARSKIAEIRDHLSQIRDARIPLEPEHIRKLLDRYRNTNVFNSYQIVLRDGSIIASYSRVYDDQNRLLTSLYNLTLLTMDQFIQQEGSVDADESKARRGRLAAAEMAGDALNQMLGQRETSNLSMYRGQFLSFRYGALDIGVLIDVIRQRDPTKSSGRATKILGGYFFFFENDYLYFDLLTRTSKGFFSDNTRVYFQSPVRYFLKGGSIGAEHPAIKRIFKKLETIAEGGRLTERVTLDGEVWLCSALKLPITKYSLIILRPLNVVIRSIHLIRVLLALVLIGSLLTALLIAAVLMRVYLTPINQLTEGVEAVAGGNLDFRVQLQTHDEFFELGKTFNMMVQQLQEKIRLSRFVSESVWDIVKKDSGTLELGGEERHVSVLFCDLRGFTTIAEAHPPQEVVSMLNEYLDAMTEVVRRHHGVVDKFIGDAVMAVFYPLDTRDHEKRAVLCGLEMMHELKRFNRRREEAGLFALGMGVGISSGLVVAGKIGSKNGRIDYTVIGDTVNVAARLEGVSKVGKHTRVIVSDATWQAVKEMFEAEPMGMDRVKGKAQQVQMFEIVGPRRVEQFLQDLDSPDEPRRLAAVQALGLSGQAQWIERLIPLLRDANPRVRSSTAQALKNLISHDQRIVFHLKEALLGETDAYVIASFILDIGLLGSDSDRLELVQFLDHEDNRIRANTVEALSFMRDRRQLQSLLRPKLTDPNNRTRANAAMLLYQTGDLEGMNALLEMCAQANSPLMRASGAYGVGEVTSRERAREIMQSLGRPDAVVTEDHLQLLARARLKLEALLQDADQMVRRNAARALGRMGHESSLSALVKCFRSLGAEDPARSTVLSAITEIAGSHVLRMLDNELAKTHT